jgi:hypothetical protein
MRPATTFCAAFFLANFLSFIGADLWYATTRPTTTDLTAGRIYPHTVKGSPTVYLTAAESTGLSLLPLGASVGFAAIAITYSREPKKRTRMGRIKELVPTKRDYSTLWGAVACYIAIVVIAGPSIGNLVVSRGLVLNFD